MKNKGFTLVELLVAIVILGIITGLSIPLLRVISNNRTEKQYKTYMDSMIASAKLYNDSYSEDLFGKNENGCARVSFQTLNEAKLLKDIKISNISCNSDYSKVRILKLDGQYYYTGVLGCGADKNKILEDKNGEISYKYPSSDVSCTGNDKSSIDVKIVGTTSELFNKKMRSANIKLSSSFGINPDIGLSYAWSLNNDYNSISSDSWKHVNFKSVPTIEKQKNDMKEGNIIVNSDDITTPSGVTGQYYLFVRIDRLNDIFMNSWVNAVNSDINYISSGPFSVDNDAPVFNDSSVISSKSEYNDLKPKLNLKVTDNHTASNKLKMCVSLNTNSCKTDKASLKDYENYNSSKVLDSIHTAFDLSTHKVYVTVVDLAGNTALKSFDYKLAKKYTLTYDSNGGSTCSKKEVILNDGVDGKWGTLCSPTRTNYNFLGWKTSSNADFTADSKVTDNITVKASWSIKTVTISYNANGGSLASDHGDKITLDSSGNVLSNGTIAKQTINFNSKLGKDGLLDANNKNNLNLVKSNYTFNTSIVWNTKSDGSGNSFNQSSQYSASDFCTDSCDIVLYTNWLIAKPPAPTITNDSGGNWTNKNVKLTMSSTFPADLIGTWYYKVDNGSYNKLTTLSLSYSDEMNKKIQVIVCNKNASSASDSANCSDAASTNVKIDKTPPNDIEIKYVLGNNYYTSNYGTGDRGSMVLPYLKCEGCTDTDCGKDARIKWKPSTDKTNNGVSSGISHYIFNYDCQCYNSSNTGKRTNGVRCDLGSRNPNTDCTRVINRKITGVVAGREYGVDDYGPADGKPFFGGHAGYWKDEGGYIGQSWDRFAIYAVDKAGNKSAESSWGTVYCTNEKKANYFTRSSKKP